MFTRFLNISLNFFSNDDRRRGVKFDLADSATIR